MKMSFSWKLSNFLFFILGLVYLVSTEECPNIKTVSNFVPTKYLGKWFEIQKYPQIFELESECVSATYSLNPNGTIGVLNQAITPVLKLKIEIKGFATPNPTNSANLTVEFPPLPVKGQYWVIDTDYTTYSLVYSCSLDMNKRMESAWVLSRSRELKPEVINKLTLELAAVKSSTNLFHKTKQTGCPE